MRILVTDDDPTMALLVRRLLEEEGYTVDVSTTLESARVEAMVNDYDAIVLDLALPDGNSIPLVHELRREGRNTPVLVLTGSTDTPTTVRALDAGADDYLTKPFSFDEFKARVRALLRRGGAQRTEHLVAGNLVFDRLGRSALVRGVAMQLTAREISLLEHLLLHTGVVVPRTQLLEKVFDLTFEPGTNVVDVNVSRLRRKLKAAGATLTIVTRRGIGFELRA